MGRGTVGSSEAAATDRPQYGCLGGGSACGTRHAQEMIAVVEYEWQMNLKVECWNFRPTKDI